MVWPMNVSSKLAMTLHSGTHCCRLTGAKVWGHEVRKKLNRRVKVTGAADTAYNCMHEYDTDTHKNTPQKTTPFFPSNKIKYHLFSRL